MWILTSYMSLYSLGYPYSTTICCFIHPPHHFATLTLLFLGIFSLCFPLISGLEINCANIFITPWLSPQILSEHRNAYLGLYFS